MTKEHQAGDIDSVEETIDQEVIKHRSITGALAFTGRTVLIQLVGFFAVFLLTIFLSPQEYGIFYIVEATVGFLIYFSDIGLAAALIQKKEKITKQDLATTFTIQQFLVITLMAIAILFTPQIAAFYDYTPQAITLFRVLVIAFFLSSLKTIPSVLLERELDFNRLVIPQILESLVFYGVAVYFAWQGRGVASFSYAVMARAIVGLVAIYALKPWVPRFGFDKKIAKSLASFGAPFQLNSILALFKDKAMIMFLGKVLTKGQVGYLGWAERWAMTPIRFFADPVLKVTFPAYSRLQSHKQELKKAIEKSVFFVGFLVFPSVVGMVAVAPELVNVIPKYTKWQPALFAFSMYGINAIISSISITLTNTLNATGKVNTTLKLMVMWTMLTWTLTPALIFLVGWNGVAIASALTAASSIIAIFLVKRIVSIQIMPQVLPPTLASIFMAIAIFLIQSLTPTSASNLLIQIFLGAAAYFIFMLILFKTKVTHELAIVRKYLLKLKK